MGFGGTDSNLEVCRVGEKLSEEPGVCQKSRAPQVMLCLHGGGEA